MSFEEIRSEVDSLVKKLKGLVSKIQTGSKDDIKGANSEAQRLIRGARHACRTSSCRAYNKETRVHVSLNPCIPARGPIARSLQRPRGASSR